MAPVPGPVTSVLLLAFGLPTVVYAERVARLREQLDAIGSTRSPAEVEPAGWYVTLTRISGLVLVVVGLAGLFVAV